MTPPRGSAQRLIPLEARREWEEALRGIPHDFGHDWEGAQAYRLTTGLPISLYHFERNGARVVCPVVERSFGEWRDVTTPHGFTGFVEGSDTPSDFPDHWHDFARAQGWVCGYLAFHPILANAVELPEARTYNQVYPLDLRKSEDALRAGLSRNRRRELRAWDTSGEPVLRDRAALTEFLVREYPRFLERVGAPGGYARTSEALRYLCGLERTILCGIGTPEDVRSVYVFVHTDTIGTCLHYVSLPDARDHGAVLVWSGVQELRARGVLWLNLGGGNREGDSIARSKERYGAAAQPVRAVRQVYRPDVYERLCRSAGVDPTRPGFFPAYRAPFDGVSGSVPPSGIG